MTLEQTTEVAAEVELDARVERQLRHELKVYADLDTRIDQLKEDLEMQKNLIELLRVEVGAKSFKVAGCTITRVDGTSKSLNKKKLFASGVTPAQLAAAYETKPKKAYTLITLPGEEARKPQRSYNDEEGE